MPEPNVNIINRITSAKSDLFFNLDAYNQFTASKFVVAKDRTGDSGGTVLLEVSEDGTVDIKTASGLKVAGAAVTATPAELNILDGVTANSNEINAVADVSSRVQEVTASVAITSGKQSVELNHATTLVEPTLADFSNHQGLFIVKNTSPSGTVAHTLTLTIGTFDGTNTVATLNAPGEALVVYVDSNGDGVIVENIGAVVLS